MIDSSDATDLAAAVRSGRISARTLVGEALGRIAEHRTNAVVTPCPTDALARAADIDAAVERGDDPGPLAGVPFTVKDTIATAHLRTTGGSLLFAEHVPAVDAAVVTRLRAAGAILVGKTNCPEFALQARTDNRRFGPTVHPLDDTRSPGGSSGGCAAAVAGGLVPFSIGGDYGGSVRYPAACTGIYGLRPTYRAVPTEGHVPEPTPRSPRHRFQTIGPLARTPRDIRLVFDVIAGTVPAPGSEEGVGTTVGVVRGGWPCAGGIGTAVDRAARAFADAGFAVIDVDPAPFLEASAVFDAWRATDDYADLRAVVTGREDDLTSHIAHLLEASPPRPLPDLQHRFDAVAEVVAAVTAPLACVILPVARVGVPALDATTAEIDGRVESLDSLQILAPSRAISLLGLPALAIPAGTDGDGFPVGVQIVGPPGAEHRLSEIANRVASAPAFGDAPVRAFDHDL